jgi:hypothetical protein
VADVKIDNTDAVQLTLKLETGIMKLSRQESLSETDRKFVSTVSRTGAELVVNLLSSGRNHKLPTARDMVQKTILLRDADSKMFPHLPMVERESESTEDLVRTLQAHAGAIDRTTGDLFAINRANMEDSATAISGMISLMVDANQGLGLDQHAQEDMEVILRSYDQAFPPEA